MDGIENDAKSYVKVEPEEFQEQNDTESEHMYSNIDSDQFELFASKFLKSQFGNEGVRKIGPSASSKTDISDAAGDSDISSSKSEKQHCWEVQIDSDVAQIVLKQGHTPV